MLVLSCQNKQEESINFDRAANELSQHLQYRALTELKIEASDSIAAKRRSYAYALQSLAIYPKETAEAMSIVLNKNIIQFVSKELWRSPAPGKDQYYGLAFQPGGNLLATTTSTKKVRIWDVLKQKELLSARLHNSVVTDVIFLDKERIVSSSMDGTICFSNTENLEAIKRIRLSKTGILDLKLSPDKRFLATAAQDGVVRLVDLKSSEVAKQFQGHSGPILSLSFSPDSRYLASSSRDGNTFIWNLETSTREFSLPQQNGAVSAISFSPEGKTLAVSGSTGNILLYDMASKQIQSTLACGSPAKSLVWLSGNTLYCGLTNGEIQRWNSSTSVKEVAITAHYGDVRSLELGGNAKLISTGSDKAVSFWTSDLVRTSMISGHNRDVLSVAVSPNKMLYASGGFDKTIRIWDIKSGTEKLTFYGHQAEIFDVVFSADSRLLFSASADGTIKVWDLASEICIQTLNHENQVLGLAYHPQTQMLAAVSQDKTTSIWRLDNNKLSKSLSLKGHNAPVVAAAFSEDGSTLHTAGRDNSLRSWNVETGKQLSIKKNIYTHYFHSQFSSNGQQFATAVADTQVWIYNTKNGVGKRVFNNTDQIRALEFFLDKKRIAIGDIKGNITIIDKNGTLLEKIQAHGRDLWDFALLPGRADQILSGGRDHSLAHWQLSSPLHSSQNGFSQKLRMLHGSYIDANGQPTIAASALDSLHWLNAETGKSMRSKADEELLHSTFLYANRYRYAAYGNDGTITVLEMPEGRKRLIRETNDAVTMQLSGDGSTIALSRQKGELKFIKTDGGDSLYAYALPALSRRIAFSHDARFAAADCADGNIYIFDLPGKTLLNSFNCPTADGSVLAFTPDNSYLAYSDDSFTIRLHNLQTGQDEDRLFESESPLSILAFSKATPLLAVGRKWVDADLELWNWKEKQLVATIPLPERAELKEILLSDDGGVLYYRLANQTTKRVDLSLLTDYLQNGTDSELLLQKRDQLLQKFGYRFDNADLIEGERKRVFYQVNDDRESRIRK